MYSRKKSTFSPHYFTNEDMSISLGSEFTFDDEIYQDFYHTGEYFLICRSNSAESDISIFVTYFDKEQGRLQYKVLRLQVPLCSNYEDRTTTFDATGGKVIHAIQKRSEETEHQQDLVCDIYYFDVSEFLEFDLKNHRVKELTIEAKAKAYSLNWNYNEFNNPEIESDFWDNGTRGLVFKASSNHNLRCRVDILRFGNQNQIFHSNTINR